MYDWGESWLGKYLNERGFSPQLVRQCEEKLVIQEGFGSPFFLMRVNFQNPFFDRAYLNKLGIKSLGLCETLLTLQKDLVSAAAERGQTVASGTTTAASVAVKILFPDYRNDGCSGVPVLTQAISSKNDKKSGKLSWLGHFLTQNGVDPNLVQHCEKTLVRTEGFGNPLILARLNDNLHFNRAYLSNLGINALGVREALLDLQSQLQQAFKSKPYSGFRTENGSEAAARAAVKMVLPDYLGNDTGYFEEEEEESSCDAGPRVKLYKKQRKKTLLRIQDLVSQCGKRKRASAEEGSEAGSKPSGSAYGVDENTA